MTRRAILISVIGLIGAAGVWALLRQPPPVAIQARLQAARVYEYIRLSPGPVESCRTIIISVEVPASIAAMLGKHVAYGELRSLPDGPVFFLSHEEVVDEDGSRARQWKLDLASNDVTSDELRWVLADDAYRFEVLLRIGDQSHVLAESGWLDATSLLRPLASQL